MSARPTRPGKGKTPAPGDRRHPRPLADLAVEALRAVRAVFTDLDGTLTTGGRVLSSTYDAMWALADAGVSLVLVTGRPAGWGDAFARTWPVEGVIAENGGVSFLRRPGRDGKRSFAKLYARPFHRLAADRARLEEAVDAVRRAVPGARLSEDSRYTEVDMAIDWNEEVHLGEAAADGIEAELRRLGLSAVRSSVHVNFWVGPSDKLSACKRLLRELEGKKTALPVGAQVDLSPYVYVGDSLNDEPMFAAFPHSVGVANVAEVMGRLATPPAYVTRQAEGRGFEEVAQAILAARKAGRRTSSR